MESVDLEIDTKLFITCRLCLEDLSNQDTGVYQIIPAVREQLTYCFDIIVEPFDGLPQLLCRKCKLLLNEYSTKKKEFTEKQDYLKQKLKIKKDILAPKSLQSPACPENNVGEISKSEQEPEKIKPNKRRESSSSTDTVESSKSSKKKRKSEKYHDEKLITNLKKTFRKHFVCRICTKKYKNKKSVLRHGRKQHTSLRQKHSEFFKQKCMVYLDKIDNKPNTTGLRNSVAISQEKVVQDEGKQLYYIVYSPRIEHDLNLDAESESFVNGIKNVCSDSSNDDIISSSRRKRLRLDSKSSNDTVCIDGNETNGPDVLNNSNKSKTVRPNTKSADDKLFGRKDTVCINIDDSSDSDTATNSNVCLKKTVNSFDIKTIESIISVCRSKYEARFKRALSSDSDKAQIESQLKHKILSIGRKTINRQGFSHCTGLLRYLEHKNLNVKWESKSQMLAIAAKETNFVRILTKMDSSWNSADEPGWVDVPEKHKHQELVDSLIRISVSTPPPAAVEQPDAVPSPPQISQTSPHVDEQPDTDQAVLYQCYDDYNTTKLLNPNPVANPKQLPKKVHMHDTKPIIINRLPTESLLVSSSEQIDESNMLMPVITSTTSLAGKLTEENNGNSNSKSVNQNSDKPIPRIRLKPVSELMKPESMLNITPNHTTNVWNFNKTQNEQIDHDNSQNIYVPNNLVSQIQSQSTSLPSSNILPVEKITSEPNKLSSDFITLDSIDLPNTKTESPFKYFRNLLLLHGLILTEANASVPRDFVCLLKFKVQFKQENKAHPVTLCLSLFCSENTFCMSIKDNNLINIQMAKMSANWQWEIMKVYQGNVVEKILQNAQKAGVDVHNNTRTFVNLLKSINQVSK